MTTSHADNHDRDKLARWYRDLASSPGPLSISHGEGVSRLVEMGVRPQFPVYAIFLVSANDRTAHDIFRQFRSSFEARAARFEHLVIFGQHGVSSTVQGLLAEFGWFAGGSGSKPAPTIPVLVLAGGPSATTIHALPLPVGSRGDQRVVSTSVEHWQDVLAYVEGAADDAKETVDLASLPELTAHQLGGRSLVELVGRLLNSLDR